ncbi:PEP-CTERM/exosortase system-associated acyltransferase [Candidatus Methylomicrobium oryzae]|jgi:N-acyl amino acid synthase of PEP-CTERM/exosortase system|uniref:PEP-CTERM/exosortase system-associated acyltransferase n=1 Tax=Candidatus Methylomicrobium oryzae TaxID=2802053 RepID=UPI0019242473|nr:PEP-CTERM/exosortase system-associated acyltransferase [Methylomicrobium sp. RS1]MBL1262376.1 PEP-CTERM/exosortase system-associated acyltransferase [Methylomicrobium sp. RS1]
MDCKLSLVTHYKKYFCMVKALSPEMKKIAFNIRYRVYFEEQNMIATDGLSKERLETDLWDAWSIHTLLYHKPSGQPIGNVRLVPLDASPTKTLPIEESYPNPFDFSQAPVQDIRSGKTGEVSRMLILSSFRRRKSDKNYDLGSGESSSEDQSDKRFPINYLPVCLIFATAILMLEEKLDYGVGLMEPRLARLLMRFGVGLNRIGETTDYFGPRAPYLIFPELIYKNLSPDYQALYDAIQSELIN